MVFLSRFVGAAANPHLAGYGGNYLGFMVLGLLGGRVPAGRRLRSGPADPHGADDGDAGGRAGDARAALDGAGRAADVRVRRRRRSARRPTWSARRCCSGWTSAAPTGSRVALAVPLIVAAFSGLGLLAAGTTMLVRRLNPVAMIIGSLSFFLSGVLYPVTVLPAWLRGDRRVCCRSRMRWRCCAARCWSAPARPRWPIRSWRCSSSPACWRPSASAVFAFALRRARIDGSLSHY